MVQLCISCTELHFQRCSWYGNAAKHDAAFSSRWPTPGCQINSRKFIGYTFLAVEEVLLCGATGKRKMMGFREAFAEVHAANDEMRSLYVQLAASSEA